MTEPAQPTPVPTAPPFPDTSCGRCKFVVFGPTPAQPPFCRRYPPTAFLINVQFSEDKTQVVSQQQISSQPTVNPYGSCGEFVRREEDVH